MLSVFDLVLVINLRSRPDRLREVRNQLQDIGLDFNDTIRVMHAVRPSDAAGFRTIGAHGCFRSHMSCLEEAVRVGASSVLILEDDVDFQAGLMKSSAHLASWLSAGEWDMFYGGYSIDEPLLDTNAPVVARGLRRADAGVSIGLAHFLAVRGNAISALHEYLTAMIKRPAGDPAGGAMDVDGAYNWFRNSDFRPRTLLADPQLAFQRASPSDISARQWYDRTPVVASLARLGRILRRQIRQREDA